MELQPSHSQDEETVALVSVLVRSMNRAELRLALQSVEQQTYPNIEIVLVDAGGKGLDDYSDLALRTPVRKVADGTARNRPAAANAALAHARGEFLLFLDEDDWIAPAHLHNLVGHLSSNSSAVAAYSSTQLVTAEGESVGQPLRIKFDRTRLQRDNFIPIHAALFRQSAVAAGCRFDESLDIFEDWDFWLQLSRLGDFFHVDELTAFYRQGGGSATASQPPATRYQQGHPIAEARARVFQKWLSVWNGSDINQMLGSVEQPAVVESLHGEVRELASEVQRLHQQVHKSHQLLNRKEAELQDARAHIARLSNDIQLFYRSVSWRLTRPVRALKRVLVGLGASEIKQRLLQARRSADVSEHEHIFFNLDPEPEHGEHPEVLTLVGWSCSVAGIDRIEALVDGEPRTAFGTGISRPDVAKVHPDCADSDTAGFFEEISLQDLTTGEHTLELRVFDKAGHTTSIQQTFMLRKGSDIYNSWYWNHTPTSANPSPIPVETAPLFHLVVLDNGDSKALQTTIGSIREQFRSNWQIILVSATAVAQDTSFLSLPPSKLTIVPDLQSAIEYVRDASGWSVFLTGGETLAPHAIEEWSFASKGDAQLIYSDHDLRSPTENHLAPCFTPQWAPDHLLSSNYVGGVYAIRNPHLQLLAGIDLSSPAWRYALVLEFIPAQLSVQRVAKVLWSAPESTSLPQTVAAETAVVKNWLQRVHPLASLSERNGIRHVAWPLDETLKVSIIIPTMGKLELLRPCLESILQKTAYRNFELIMLDNSRGKYPDGIAYLKDLGLNVIECNEPFNWARLNNIGARHASGNLYLFLNDDIEVTDEQWLGELVRQANRPDVGTVGALLYYPNGALQHAGVVLVDHGGGCTHLLYKRMPSDTVYRRMHETTREVAASTGACLMLTRSRFEEIGGFDEELAVVGNDIDLCLRLLERGYRNVWTPHCQLVHHESISRKSNSPRADERTMWERWGKLFLAGDPYYNPNLSLTRADFSLAGGTQPAAATAHHAAASERFSPGVNLIGYTRAEMGVGEGARGDAKALTAVQEPFGIICFQSGNPSRMSDLSWQHKETDSAPYDVTLVHINPDQAYRAISELPASHFDGHYRIGYWAWELPRIPEEWKRAFAYFDEIWAPSRFVQEAVAMSSPIPVVRIPHAVEVTADAALTRKEFGLPDNAFLFLSMYDTYSLPERKNPLGALRAFCQAFEPNDLSVRMVLKINNSTPEGIRSLKNVIGSRENVVLLDAVYARPQVNALLANIDCFVSLHRSEGFGLGPAEAMALGKPVVATNWSGNVDYMRPGNSMPVDYRLVALEEDHGPYERGQIWAEPDIDHAARAMRELVATPRLAEALGTRAKITIEEEFSPLAVGRMMRERLSAIRENRSS